MPNQSISRAGGGGGGCSLSGTERVSDLCGREVGDVVQYVNWIQRPCSGNYGATFSRHVTKGIDFHVGSDKGICFFFLRACVKLWSDYFRQHCCIRR